MCGCFCYGKVKAWKVEGGLWFSIEWSGRIDERCLTEGATVDEEL